jgi:predicted metal-binding protein
MAENRQDQISPRVIAHASRGRQRTSAKISPGFLDEIRPFAINQGFVDIQLLETAQIVTGHWVGLKCRYGCAKYDTNWCCPPAAPGLETVREILSEYEVALLLISENVNSHFYRNSFQKRHAQVKHWKAVASMERRLFLMGFYKVFGLSAETCAICKQCAYPKRCKFPSEKRPSLEAFSIDVFQTLSNIGLSAGLARKVEDHYHSYSLILLA